MCIRDSDRIQLLPLNPAFEPITLEPEDAGDLTVIGEYVAPPLTLPFRQRKTPLP